VVVFNSTQKAFRRSNYLIIEFGPKIVGPPLYFIIGPVWIPGLVFAPLAPKRSKHEELVWAKFNLPSQNHLPIQGVQIRVTSGGTHSFLSTPPTRDPQHRLIRSRGGVGVPLGPPRSIRAVLRRLPSASANPWSSPSAPGGFVSVAPPGFIRAAPLGFVCATPPGFVRAAPPGLVRAGSAVCRAPLSVSHLFSEENRMHLIRVPES
jgi:hypothetical protein